MVRIMEVKTKTMHAKSDSDVTTTLTSIDLSSPSRSPRPAPLYYVKSPSNHDHDAEKMSFGSSLPSSPPPPHRHSHSSSIQHSRESSISRFSVSSLMKNQVLKHSSGHRKKISQFDDFVVGETDEDYEAGGHGCSSVRLCLCSVFWFVLLFSVFSIILWGASKGYKPIVRVQHIVFHSVNHDIGYDNTGVLTEKLSLNSTVKIFYKNPATYFGVHVSSTPVELYYYDLKVASGQMEEFYKPRKSQQDVATTVLGQDVPLYGAQIDPRGSSDNLKNIKVPLNMTFVMRSRAHILGQLVESKFYSKIVCSVTLKSNDLGKTQILTNSCSDH